MAYFLASKYNANIIGVSKDLPSNPNMHTVLANEKEFKKLSIKYL